MDRFLSYLCRMQVALVSLVMLLSVGVFTKTWELKLWSEAKPYRPEARVIALSESLEQGMILGLVGGFRSIIADFLFIRAYVYWEERELTKMQTTYELALSIDPRALELWLDAAHIIAYDAPVWRIQAQQKMGDLSEEAKQQIHAEQATAALDFIQRASYFHPNDYRIPLAQAQIYMHKLDDDLTASTCFLKGSRMDGAPDYMERLHAELLMLDRPQSERMQ